MGAAKMKPDRYELRLPKRGIWGGYRIERVGIGKRAYFWIGSGNKYLMALTMKEAAKVRKFLK